MRDQRNTRCLTLAHRLENIIALAITQGIWQLEHERSLAKDGPNVGESAGRSNNTTSTTERNASEVHRLGLMIDDLRDALAGAEIAVNHLEQMANDAIRTRAFQRPPRPGQPVDSDIGPQQPICRDNQKGREGLIEWGDATCLYSAVKAGLCRKHYMAWYRYRQLHQIRTDRDFEPGAA